LTFYAPESRVFYQEPGAGASAIPLSKQCDTAAFARARELIARPYVRKK
jgi:hypothetical protein